MTVQVVSAVPARPSEPVLYDFARPMSMARDHSLALKKGSESFARSWSTELSTKLRTTCRVSVLDVAMMSYDDYIERLPETTVMMLSTIGGRDERAVMQFPLRETLIWATLMMGGNGARAIAERPLSPIEQALITKIVGNVHELMRYTFGPLFPPSTSVESVQYTPQSAKAAAPSDSMVVTSFEVAVDDLLSTITMALPSDALSHEVDEIRDAPTAAPADLMLAQLEAVPVRVSLQFQPTRMRPEAVLGLVEGDLIRMSHSKNRPLNFAVEGQIMAKAAVGASGSQLACVIVDTQEAS